MWRIGNVVLKACEVESAQKKEARQIAQTGLYKGDSPNVQDAGIADEGLTLTLTGTLYSQAKLALLRQYLGQKAKNLVEVQEGVLIDDCEGLSLYGGTWILGNNATVGNTETKKVGAKAIYLKGGTTDYPYVEVEFSAVKDWSLLDELDAWLAPLNDDETPATGKTVRIRVTDSDGEYDYYEASLSATADTYTLKRCQLNDSGEGNEPTGSSGTLDTTKVGKLRVTGQWADDNLDLAFDHIMGSRIGDFYDGVYHVKTFNPSPVMPVPGIAMWNYSLELVYVETL